MASARTSRSGAIDSRRSPVKRLDRSNVGLILVFLRLAPSLIDDADDGLRWARHPLLAAVQDGG
jgi:hypothetical protein